MLSLGGAEELGPHSFSQPSSRRGDLRTEEDTAPFCQFSADPTQEKRLGGKHPSPIRLGTQDRGSKQRALSPRRTAPGWASGSPSQGTPSMYPSPSVTIRFRPDLTTPDPHTQLQTWQPLPPVSPSW